MGVHEGLTMPSTTPGAPSVPLVEETTALTNIKVEVELGFDEALAANEAQRCLNCDVQTVFTDNLCIECDAVSTFVQWTASRL